MKLPEQPREFKMLISGRHVNASDHSTLERLSPAHDIPVSRIPEGQESDVDQAIAAAREAFDKGSWPWTAGGDRAAILMKVAEKVRETGEELAFMETLETGKPLTQSRAEVEWTVGLWEYAAALCRHLYGDSCNTLGPTTLGATLRDPIGVVGLITPWNFPLLIISQKLPFALAAGCTCVIKPAALTSATTLILADLITDAGIPAGVVNVVTGHGSSLGGRMASHDDVDMLSFTGSTEVGKAIVRASAGNLKKVSLECGGKNPLIVCDDADLEGAVDAARLGAYFNMGECCNSSSRILVQDGIADRFVEAFSEAAAQLPVGDPFDEKTKLGAIVSDQQADVIMGYVEAGKQEGARVALGGERMQTPRGRFIQTTVLDHVAPTARVAKEEIFGPVLSVIRFKTVNEAIDIANSTHYGLSAGIYTRDYDTVIHAARRLRAGTVWINTWLQGHPEQSFGGYKQSGLGRELGRTAVEEFTEPKTVVFQTGPRVPWW
jgi:betaine-aldehyde dehydrogenase